MEVNFSTEKRKLEALYAQHNRSKHRLADNVKYLKGADERVRLIAMFLNGSLRACRSLGNCSR